MRSPEKTVYALLRLAISLYLALALVPARADQLTDASAIAVIYPDIGDPFRSVFNQIIEGVEARANRRVNTYPVGPNSNPAELSGLLKHNGTRVVIALGRQGVNIASRLDRDIAVVVGAVLSAPEAESHNLTGISLTPDPALLFAFLKKLLPSVKRVTVIYDPQNNAWLLKLAQAAAKAQGLELLTHEAPDLATAARFYDATFAAADSRLDAIWLPHDATTVDETTILPLVLKESWIRGIAIFSSSVLHVRKGVLFALYPNNLELGRDLANSALDALAGESRKRGLSPLRTVYTAVNLRTASHIGLTIDQRQQRSFNFIFPEP